MLLAAMLVGLGGALAQAARPAGTPGSGSTVSVVTLPLRAVIVSRSTAGSVLTLTVGCKNGASTDVCSGPISLTGTGGQDVGDTTYSVLTGTQTTLTIPLNPTGDKLLAQSYHLAATLALGGPTTITRAVNFHYPLIKSPVAFTFAFGARSTTVQYLAVSQVPTGGMVEVICRGGGCPFGSQSFTPTSGGTVALTSSLKSSPLSVRATLELEITETDSVGKVVTFMIESGAQPLLTVRCLPPGATAVTHCA